MHIRFPPSASRPGPRCIDFGPLLGQGAFAADHPVGTSRHRRNGAARTCDVAPLSSAPVEDHSINAHPDALAHPNAQPDAVSGQPGTSSNSAAWRPGCHRDRHARQSLTHRPHQHRHQATPTPSSSNYPARRCSRAAFPTFSLGLVKGTTVSVTTFTRDNILGPLRSNTAMGDHRHPPSA